ncbi:MAG: polysaccharide deacetylase family protein [Clostridia bacterium]|nr:polysaccharide deacetylase family protein [Clostridia bacterium]
MGNGRFGPIRQRENQKKRYKMDYNRFITFIMVVVIAVIGILLFKDYKAKEKEADFTILDANTPIPGYSYLSEKAPESTLSPDEIRPLPEGEGLLPVFSRANTNDMKIAITIDGLMDADNIYTLMGLCATYGAKVTFFPTGDELANDKSVWPMAILSGHEIENHTYSDIGLSRLPEDDIRLEIETHTELLRSIIGADYQPHFLRTSDMGDDLNADVHRVLNELGYMGVARWSTHTPSGIDKVSPGMVIAYTLNDKGLSALSAAIPVLVENGYELVTLNDLFQYPGSFPETDLMG